MKQLSIISLVMLCCACSTDMDVLADSPIAATVENSLSEYVAAPTKTIRTETFTVNVPEDSECKLDSMKELEGMVNLSICKAGKKYNVLYVPFALRHEITATIASERSRVDTSNDFVTMIAGRPFKTHIYDDSSKADRVYTWENGECSLLVVEKSGETAEMGEYNLIDNIQFLVPEKSEKSLADRVDALSKLLKNDRGGYKILLEDQKLVYQHDVRHAYRYRENPHEAGAHELSELVKGISLFHECAEQGYTFEIRLLDDKGQMEFDEIYSGGELTHNALR